MSRHVVVVGAGVIGAACAYYLSKRGWAVTILDGAGFGEGCSHANCGYVSPSHVLPLAGPGAILSTLKTALRRNSPIRLKPRLDPALWRWLLRFARRCNRRDMLAAGKAIQALLNSSRRLYEELIREEGIDCDWEARGVLFVLRSAAAMAHFGEIDHLLRTHFDLPAERWNAAELTDREPALKPGLAGAWHYPGDAHLRPDRLMSAWRRVLERRGVRFVRANVETLCGERRGVSPTCRAVRTADGNVPADAFVFATGALTPLLQGELGCPVLIQPGKGYSITMPRPTLCPSTPMLFEEDRVAVTPLRSGFRLGSMMEFVGYDRSLPAHRLDYLRKIAERYLREPYTEPIEERWFGWRPMTPDGVPIIDRAGWGNVYLAAGHNMLGLSMAPATGKLVAEMLSGEETHINLDPYRLARFA